MTHRKYFHQYDETVKNATSNLESIPSYRERERSMNSIVLWRSRQADHTLLVTSVHGDEFR